MPDHIGERFEWDTEKSDRCFRERGFDFAFASQVFDAELYYEEADDRSYGEERNKCVGLVADIFITVIYTPREGRKRIISAWRSAKDEVEEYVKHIGL